MKPIIAILALVVVTGCTSTRIGDFTVLSTKNMELSKMDRYERSGLRKEGEDLKFWSQPSMEEAVDQVIESVPGCRALVDVTVKVVQRAFTAGYEVEGECLVDVDAVGVPPLR